MKGMGQPTRFSNRFLILYEFDVTKILQNHFGFLFAGKQSYTDKH